MTFSEVFRVPLSISLAVFEVFLAWASILKKFVEEFNRKNFYLLDGFESWNVYMGSFSDVQKYTVKKENVRFYIKMLAPRKTEIKKELR